jgi:hypothetical protein
LVDEAAAIVEAEWMRLKQDEELRERAVAELLAEMPAPQPLRPGSAHNRGARLARRSTCPKHANSLTRK